MKSIIFICGARDFHAMEQISTEKAEEFLNKNELMRMFSLHKKDKGNYGFLLWKTLIFAVWLNKNNEV